MINWTDDVKTFEQLRRNFANETSNARNPARIDLDRDSVRSGAARILLRCSLHNVRSHTVRETDVGRHRAEEPTQLNQPNSCLDTSKQIFSSTEQSSGLMQQRDPVNLLSQRKNLFVSNQKSSLSRIQLIQPNGTLKRSFSLYIYFLSARHHSAPEGSLRLLNKKRKLPGLAA